MKLVFSLSSLAMFWLYISLRVRAMLRISFKRVYTGGLLSTSVFYSIE